MTDEYESLIEEVSLSKYDSDQLLKIMIVSELRNISRHLYNLDLSLREVMKR